MLAWEGRLFIARRIAGSNTSRLMAGHRAWTMGSIQLLVPTSLES